MAMSSPFLLGMVLYLLLTKPALEKSKEECEQRLVAIGRCEELLGLCSTDEVMMFRKLSRCTSFEGEDE